MRFVMFGDDVTSVTSKDGNFVELSRKGRDVL